MADVLAVLLVAAVLLVLVACVSVVRGAFAHRRATADGVRSRWWVDAEPTGEGRTRVVLRRGMQASLFRELAHDADEAAVQDAIAEAEIRADTLNARSSPRA